MVNFTNPPPLPYVKQNSRKTNDFIDENPYEEPNNFTLWAETNFVPVDPETLMKSWKWMSDAFEEDKWKQASEM